VKKGDFAGIARDLRNLAAAFGAGEAARLGFEALRPRPALHG
jgi:hypothetical protein